MSDTTQDKPLVSWKQRTIVACAIIGAVALGATTVVAVNVAPQEKPIVALTSELAVAGYNTTQVVTNDGLRLARGANSNGELTVPSGENAVRDWLEAENMAFTKLSGTYTHTLGIDGNKEVYGWGQNSSGETGAKTQNPTIAPTKIVVSQPYSNLSNGPDFTLAVDHAGNLLTWGQNGSGQLGVGDKKERLAPTHLLTGTKFSTVKAGIDFSMALDASGGLWVWGNNDKGQLGLGDNEPRLEPTLMEGKAWKAIEASMVSKTSMAIDSNGKLFAWGSNEFGQLGNGVDWRQLQREENDRVAKEIARLKANDESRRRGLINSCQAIRDEELRIWEEENTPDPVPTPPVPEPTPTPPVPNPTPTPTPTPTPDEEVVAPAPETPKPSWPENCEKTVDKDFVYTDTSQMKPAVIEAPALLPDSNVIVPIGYDRNFIAIAVGSQNSFAVDADNKLYGWGFDKNGQSGIGVDETTYTQVPVIINGESKYRSVDAGSAFAAAVTTKDTLHMWGAGGDTGATLGNASLVKITNVASSVANVFLGSTSGAFINTANRAFVWGTTTGGLSGNKTEATLTAFTDFGYDMNSISFSNRGAIGLNRSNQLATWGSNEHGIFGNGKKAKAITEVSRVVVSKFLDIAAGKKFSVVVDEYGNAWAFGRGYQGQTGPYNTSVKVYEPTAIPLPMKVKLVAAGQDTGYAVGVDNSVWAWGNHNPAPRLIGTLDSGVAQISANNWGVQILDEEGAVYEWSSLSAGILSTTPIAELTKLELDFKAKFIASGGSSMYLLSEDGHLYGWGAASIYSKDGYDTAKISLIDDTRKYSSVSTSETHSLFITEQGILYGMGKEIYGTFGYDGNNIDKMRAIRLIEGQK